MKKKLALVTTLSILTITLSSCNFLNDLYNSATGTNSYYSQIVAPSKSSIIDESTPPADSVPLSKASVTYKDFIHNNAYALSMTPSTGEAKLLIIPVWFNDSNKFIKEANKDNVREDIHSAYFGEASEVGWQSVKSYYETESFGSLTLDGSVSVWYEPNKNYSYYADDPASSESGAPKTTELVENATNWYFNNHPSESRKDYDRNKDGYLDGVMLIYAAPDLQTLNNDSYSNLWAYCYWIQDYSVQNPNNPGVNAFFWASYDFMYDKTKASSRTGNRYGGGDTSVCTLDTHTYIHEMGHMFGLEDYYDYSNYAYTPGGGFSMQDHNVAGHDPFSSFALGWGQAYVPTSSVTIDLKPFATSGEMIILSPKWNTQNSPFDEYLILEYYTDEGLNNHDSTYKYMSAYGKDYPIGTKDYGIRLWHVDARLLYTIDGSFSSRQITTNPNTASGSVVLLTSNTYDDGSDYVLSYLSPLASDPTDKNYDPTYAKYNLLQMIRNKTSSTYKPTDTFSSSSLFKKGDTFSMDKFSKQFVNSAKLNNGSSLGFSFTVNACNNGYASISVKKL